MMYIFIFLFLFSNAYCDYCANIYLIAATFGPADVTERMRYYLDGQCNPLSINVGLGPTASQLQDLFLKTDPDSTFLKTFSLIYRKVAEKAVCASVTRVSSPNFTPDLFQLSTCYPETTNPLVFALYCDRDITNVMRSKMVGKTLPTTIIPNGSTGSDPWPGVRKSFIVAFKMPDGNYVYTIGVDFGSASYP